MPNICPLKFVELPWLCKPFKPIMERIELRKIITVWQKKLYDTRMIIELQFRNLKMFYGLITSLPRSINGYFANYIYSILAYALK
ncbi:MAG: hypothetical protein V1649_01170 [Patescibacteria group bacterium]